jgi:CBS domain-containing protein
MKVKEVMSTRLYTTTRDATLESAARTMKDNQIGMLPVIDAKGTIVGTVTDRDIAVRAVARGLDSNRKVEEAMTPGCEVCNDEESVDDVARRMSEKRLRRMVVVSQDRKQAAGIVSLGDLAVHAGSRKIAGDVLSRVTTATAVPRSRS